MILSSAMAKFEAPRRFPAVAIYLEPKLVNELNSGRVSRTLKKLNRGCEDSIVGLCGGTDLEEVGQRKVGVCSPVVLHLGQTPPTFRCGIKACAGSLKISVQNVVVKDWPMCSLLMAYFFLSRRRRRAALALKENATTKRNKYRIPRIALLPADSSPWQYLYDSGSDAALIVVSGFNHAAFDG
jgi:hypothetical protein